MPKWHPHREQMKLPEEFSVNPLYSREGEELSHAYVFAIKACYRTRRIKSFMMK